MPRRRASSGPESSELNTVEQPQQPLVTVLLCHRNMRKLAAALAIPSYLQQDYPNLELVVVDDGDDLIHDLVEDIPDVNYLHLPAHNLSEKRNAGVQAARGDIIVHFDADDWSGPNRVNDQVQMLRDNPGAQIAGYHQALWFDFVSHRASHYRGAIWGASIAYRKSYALNHRWDSEVSLAEDVPFIYGAPVAFKDGGQNFVATMHTGNARRASVGDPSFWPFVELRALPKGFRSMAGV